MAADVPISAPAGTLSPMRLGSIRVLLFLAVLVDGYLAWVSLRGGSVAGCGPDSNCHTVLRSRWAYWLGVPVSLPALLIYGLFIGATYSVAVPLPPGRRRLAWRVLISCAVLVVGAGLWFAWLQTFVLHAFCPYCITAHGAAALASILVLSQVPLRTADGAEHGGARPVQFSALTLVGFCLAGFGTLVLLIGGQLLSKPKGYVTNTVVAGIQTNALLTASAVQSVRQFHLFNGLFVFNLDQVPIVGRPDAPHTMVSLFDYTCHHCREMHPHLMAASERFSNDLAIVTLPMPLDAKCNSIVKSTLPPHTNACALARLGLTVWQANRAASSVFDAWMFSTTQPPLPPAAEHYARQLVGSDTFDRARTNAWIDSQIRQDVALYEAVYRQFRKGYMPEVIIGTNLISGSFSREHLFQLLADQFGLKE